MIGTNKKDAQETVDAILADLPPDGDGADARLTVPIPDAAAVEQLLRERQPDARHLRRLGSRSTATSAPSASPPAARA